MQGKAARSWDPEDISESGSRDTWHRPLLEKGSGTCSEVPLGVQIKAEDGVLSLRVALDS